MLKPSLTTGLPLLLWWTAMFVFTSLPGEPPGPPAWLDNADKLGHAGMFWALGVLLLRWVLVRSGGRAPWAVIVAMIVGAAYGALDELHQQYIVYRSCDVFDWLADVAGLAAGCCTVLWERARGHWHVA
jgi:VanZ family protein